MLAFGNNGDEQDEEEDGIHNRLGLGVGVREALTPTAINGITMGEEGEGKEGKE